MISFNEPAYIGSELETLKSLITKGKKLSGDGEYSKLCQNILADFCTSPKVLLTPSCTAALELAAILCEIEPGDEVIMPSYTFVSTANAFALRGARIKFVDIRPDTMNIDETKIEEAISPKTKAIVPVHYAGVGCEMDTILQVAKKYHLKVVEDAAQGVMGYYKGKALGAIGDIGCFSFHETKNYTSGGEGGAILLNNPDYIDRAEIIREKGTNRSQFLRGAVDKYTWRDIGSSYLPSELQAAYLYPQLENREKINQKRLSIWNRYHQDFEGLEKQGKLVRPSVPSDCQHNAHMYYIKLENLQERQAFIEGMKQAGIMAVFHYVPLHSSVAGKKFGDFVGADVHTTKESERLVRLPVWYNLSEKNLDYISKTVKNWF